MPFPKKIIDEKLWNDCLLYAKENSAYSAACKYYEEIGMDKNYLYNKLRKQLSKLNFPSDSGNLVEGNRKGLSPEKIIETAKTKAVARKEAYEGIKLTPKEKKLIKDIESGTVDMESASRVIAAKAFEKLLKYPDSASFTSFIQNELLKLKRQELTDKNTWAMELVNRMFGGELPPRVCPDCGRVLVKLPVLEGEIVEDESV